MNNASLFLIFGSILVCALAGVIYVVMMITNNSSMKTGALDLAEDHQRIDTKNSLALRFSDKFVINSSLP